MAAAARAPRAEEDVAQAAHAGAAGRGRWARPARGRRRGFLLRAALQFFKSRFAIDDFLVDAGHGRSCEDRLALLGRDGPDLAARWNNEGALGDAGPAFGVEQADQRLAYGQFG